MHFGALLAGIAVLSGKEDAKHIVEHFALSVFDRAVAHDARGERCFADRLKNRIQHALRPLAADADDADGRGQKRRCDGGNGVHGHSSFTKT